MCLAISILFGKGESAVKHKAVTFLMIFAIILGIGLISYVSYYASRVALFVIDEMILAPITTHKNNDPYDEFSTFLKNDDVTNLIRSYSSSYEDNFKLSEVDVNDANTIKITFILKNGSENKVENIASVYDCIYQIFFQDYEKYYMDNCINIDFKDVGEYLSIYNITSQSTSCDIYSNMWNLSIADIAHSFPDTAHLKLCGDVYEIEEISSFKNLQVIDFPSKNLTSDEREYIKSIFPMCEIYCDYIKN